MAPRSRRLVASVALATALMLTALAAPASAQTPAACPSTFAVLHDDRIGALALPQGSYTITVLDPAQLSCAAAADRFRQFLQDFDGVLPSPWTLDPATATFRGGSGQGFSVAVSSQPSGGGGGSHPATGTRCPATFDVLHNDRIGALRLPAGAYSITLLSIGRLSCAQASSRFTAFLQDYDGRLSGGWIVDPETGTFLRSALVGFRVKPVGPPSGGTTIPGRRCGGDAFSIDSGHRFPGLRVRAGAYRIWVLRSGLSCNRAAHQLGQLLDFVAGTLPRRWTITRGDGHVPPQRRRAVPDQARQVTVTPRRCPARARSRRAAARARRCRGPCAAGA